MSNNANNLKKRLNKLNKQKNNNQNTSHNTFISVNASINIPSTLTNEERQRRLVLAEQQTTHIIYKEKELLEDYKKDKELAREVVRSQVKYAKRGQLFAFGTILLGFSFSGIFAYLSMPPMSIISIIGALGAIVSQFLGKFKSKSKTQITDHSKS